MRGSAEKRRIGQSRTSLGTLGTIGCPFLDDVVDTEYSVQGKLQRYWGQDPRLELIESSKVLPYRAEPLYDLAHFPLGHVGHLGLPSEPAARRHAHE